HGRFRESYDQVWDCGPSAVTVLYDLVLQRNALIAVPFPVPSGIRDNAMIDMLFTVCYTSPVQAAHAADYARAGLGLTFRPHERMHSVTDPATNKIIVSKIDVQKESKRVAKLVAQGMRLSTHPVSRSGWRRD